jgi:hypothetical protein
MILKRMPKVTLAVATDGAVAGVATAIDVSAAPSSTTYYACLSSGLLSKVKTKTHSRQADSMLISWNASGATGLKGATGTTGSRGPTGPGAAVFSPGTTSIYTVPAGVTQLVVEV